MTVSRDGGAVASAAPQREVSAATTLTKRAIDLTGAAALLVVLGPPMLVIAAWIRLDSPGPALFRQVRAGRRGEHFRIWKFRTMRLGADDEREELRAEADDGGAAFKLADDPRVTRAGRVLRRFSLDELPQLLNVLAGDMSLVGPRPHPLDDVSRYDSAALERLAVVPGMTGLWQVSGRSDLDWPESVALDVHYARTWTIRGDLVLLVRTVPAVLRGTGAR